MTKKEIEAFVEEMAPIGDLWTPEQVENAYGDYTLSEALAERKAELGEYFRIIGDVLNGN